MCLSAVQGTCVLTSIHRNRAFSGKKIFLSEFDEISNIVGVSPQGEQKKFRFHTFGKKKFRPLEILRVPHSNTQNLSIEEFY